MENLHRQIHAKLDFFYRNNQIPHIIFHGSSGSGKKTIVYQFLEKIYDGNRAKFKHNVMFVNCSHGKGIKFIREDLKFFAKTNLQMNQGVRFKSIVLFNADSLTTDAQSALRRCIELFSYNTRFFIIVENKHRLLNPILSRFCEIYVPDFVKPDGHVENLHTHHLRTKFYMAPLEEEKHAFLRTCLCKVLEPPPSNTHIHSHSLLSDISTEIYERGYSAVDLVDAVCSMGEPWTEEQKSQIRMKFHSVKSEFRCERLLLLYMLDFVCHSIPKI